MEGWCIVEDALLPYCRGTMALAFGIQPPGRLPSLQEPGTCSLVKCGASLICEISVIPFGKTSSLNECGGGRDGAAGSREVILADPTSDKLGTRASVSI
jgi:hypothetical protein